jgi:hypothetical protein
MEVFPDQLWAKQIAADVLPESGVGVELVLAEELVRGRLMGNDGCLRR